MPHPPYCGYRQPRLLLPRLFFLLRQCIHRTEALGRADIETHPRGKKRNESLDKLESYAASSMLEHK